MYVVATCGIFVVGVKCNVCTTGDTLNDIKKAFTAHCQLIFCLRDDEVTDVKVEHICDTDPIVNALAFMDKFTDECSNVIRRKMTSALKDSIMNVYTQVYEKEMKRKIETLRCQLD